VSAAPGRWGKYWEVDGTAASLWRRFSPPQLFVGSFLLLILLGTLGLRLLPGLYVGDRLGWLDSLFTATSAVCVTGLILVDTATYFTPLGQAFILLLIQVGGLGMITLTTLIIVTLGRRISLRQEALTAVSDVPVQLDYKRLTRDIVLFTFGFEALGALLLYLLWIREFGLIGAVWPAVFHSISAFCNAGFSIFSDSLMGFQRSPGVLVVVMALIVLGGIGFLVMEELALWWTARRKDRARGRLSLHSRIVLATTAYLVVGGWVLFTFLEWRHLLADLPLGDRLVNGLFLSVTARTAGFNTIDYGAAHESTNFLTVIMMAIGGSPGSTAGGMKTTTVALLALLAWSRLRGRQVPSAWGRSVPEETVQRSIGLFVLAFAIMVAGVFAYTTTELGSGANEALPENGTFLYFLFEAVSAFNTVGLSMGVTPRLSEIGKLATAILMLLGRVGPITFAAAVAVRAHKAGPRYRYAYEEVVVG
jgi:trk system potassium uptake protein